MLYVGIILNLDPDDSEMVVGVFDESYGRAGWARDTLPGIIRSLNTELGLGEQGIKAQVRFIDSDQPIGDSIAPKEVPRLIRNLYHDVYAAT